LQEVQSDSATDSSDSSSEVTLEEVTLEQEDMTTKHPQGGAKPAGKARLGSQTNVGEGGTERASKPIALSKQPISRRQAQARPLRGRGRGAPRFKGRGGSFRRGGSRGPPRGGRVARGRVRQGSGAQKS